MNCTTNSNNDQDEICIAGIQVGNPSTWTFTVNFEHGKAVAKRKPSSASDDSTQPIDHPFYNSK